MRSPGYLLLLADSCLSLGQPPLEGGDESLGHFQAPGYRGRKAIPLLGEPGFQGQGHLGKSPPPLPHLNIQLSQPGLDFFGSGFKLHL